MDERSIIYCGYRPSLDDIGDSWAESNTDTDAYTEADANPRAARGSDTSPATSSNADTHASAKSADSL